MKVLITRRIPRAGIELLRKHPSLELDYRKGDPLTDSELKKAVKDIDGIIAVIPDKITKEVLETGKNLKIVANFAVGYDNIDIETADSLGIHASNTPGDLTQAVAEHSMALMMAVGRKIVEADAFVTAGKYKFWDPMIFLGPEFHDKTLGLIGFGRIGQRFAEMVKGAFNMRILYNDIKRNEKAEIKVGAIFTNMDTLLEQSDIVSIHVPLLPSTKHLITSREIKKMKPTAILINTARGAIIDEDGLAVALEENWIEGAGIDVYEEEPKIYPKLKKLPNVVLTPHIASATREARIGMARLAANNIIEVLINKKPPINPINKNIKEGRL